MLVNTRTFSLFARRVSTSAVDFRCPYFWRKPERESAPLPGSRGYSLLRFPEISPESFCFLFVLEDEEGRGCFWA
jgi:hypothetical protein